METSANATRLDARKSIDRGTSNQVSQEHDYGSLMSPASPRKAGMPAGKLMNSFHKRSSSVQASKPVQASSNMVRTAPQGFYKPAAEV